jgi:hypothetical protein
MRKSRALCTAFGRSGDSLTTSRKAQAGLRHRLGCPDFPVQSRFTACASIPATEQSSGLAMLIFTVDDLLVAIGANGQLVRVCG